MNSLSGISRLLLAAVASARNVRSMIITHREKIGCAKGAKPSPSACETDVKHSSKGKSDLSPSTAKLHLWTASGDVRVDSKGASCRFNILGRARGHFEACGHFSRSGGMSVWMCADSLSAGPTASASVPIAS